VRVVARLQQAAEGHRPHSRTGQVNKATFALTGQY